MPRLAQLRFLALAAVLAIVFAGSRCGGPRDYLPAELRARVEALKADVRREPTTAETIAARNEVFWEWLNAYSLTGGPVPPNGPSVASWIFQTAFENERARGSLQDFEKLLEAEKATHRSALFPDDSLARQLDDLIYELTFKDEQPDGLGTLSLDAAGPFPIDSWQTIEQTYAVGSAPLREGATLIVAKQLAWDGGVLQIQDPAGDNYVAVRSSDPNVRFEKTHVAMGGLQGGRDGALPMPAYRVSAGVLEQGGAVTFIYGDRSGGGKGWRLQSPANDDVLLPVFVDIDGSRRPMALNWPSFRVIGEGVRSVKGFAPSIVEPGEKFALAVRSEDRLYNRAGGRIPAYEVTLNGRPFRKLAAGGPAVNVLDGLAIDAEGVYRFAFRSPDGAVSGSSNPVWVRRNPPHRIYWGETHTHTGMAEGQGTVEGSYRYAREDARLDFLGLSEHDKYMDDAEWRDMQDAVRRYGKEGEFIAFPAYEWTVRRPLGGHHNVFYRTPGRERVPIQRATNLSGLYQGLRALFEPDDVLIIPHAHNAGDWRRNDPDLERLVEIMSMHGTFEWFGNYYLQRGHRIGFIAASDDHRSRPGYSGTLRRAALAQFGGLAAVMAPAKTADDIFDGLRARKTYAVTSADRIVMDLELNGAGMGRRIPYADKRRLRARIMGTAPIVEASVVKNGAVVWTKRPSQADLSAAAQVRVAFESSSEPLFRDNPRPYRRWRGALEVRGASLKAAQALNFDNRYIEFAKTDPNDPNRVAFYTETRGRADSLLLALEGASPATEIVVKLQETVEYGKAPPRIRGYATIPAQTVRLPFSRLDKGLLIEQVPVGNDIDTITLQLLGNDRPLDYDLEFVDTDEPGRGDYYYVRVEQLNGARAWSSPIWVGGEDPR